MARLVPETRDMRENKGAEFSKSSAELRKVMISVEQRGRRFIHEKIEEVLF
jgi:hypothetical protein